jgi:hypothetical protein
MPPMTPENVAIGRIIAGSVSIAFPRPLVRTWTGMHDRRLDVLGRAIGVRDLALGLGALLALRHDAPARGWFEAGVISDTVDAAATLLAFPRLPRFARWLILAAAATGAAATYAAVRQQAQRASAPPGDSTDGPTST